MSPFSFIILITLAIHCGCYTPRIIEKLLPSGTESPNLVADKTNTTSNFRLVSNITKDANSSSYADFTQIVIKGGVIFKFSSEWVPNRSIFIINLSIGFNKTDFPPSTETSVEIPKCCKSGDDPQIEDDKAFCFSNVTGTSVNVDFHPTSAWLFDKWFKLLISTNGDSIEDIQNLMNGTCLECSQSGQLYISSIKFEEFTTDLENRLRSTIHKKIKSAARVTGTLCIVSSLFILFAISTYLFLWNEQNVHGLTQLSFLIALFLTYFVAGIRRLIGCTALMEAHLAWFLEALEDFCAVSTSANLVVLSFDLLQTLRRRHVPVPQFSKRAGCKRLTITTVMAYSVGLIVMIIGLIIKWNYKYNSKIESWDLEEPTRYLRKLLEILLCIQNDMLLGICLPIVQLVLFLLNLALYGAGVVILYKRQKETVLAYENAGKRKAIHFWVRRFTKMFLLMGLWWPLSIICIFECVSIFNYTVKIWNEICEAYTTAQHYVNYEIPWHMYIVSNFLVLQGIVICVLFVFNRKTLTGFRKRYSSEPYIVNT